MNMEDFKLIADVLSSVAAFIAIVSVLVVWANNLRKPLKVKRVVIHRKPNNDNFFLQIKNRKNYPVDIKAIGCFTRRDYTVEHKNNFSPEFLPELNYSNSPFTNNATHTIPANGFDTVKISANKFPDSISKLVFSTDTSHGYHYMKCSNLEIVNMGSGSTFGINYHKTHSSRVVAYLDFLRIYVKYLWHKVF